MKKIVETHIKGLLTQFIGTEFIELYRNRIDEVFLLYSQIYKISFVEVCEKFGVDYNLFNEIIDYKGSEEQKIALGILKSRLACKYMDTEFA